VFGELAALAAGKRQCGEQQQGPESAHCPTPVSSHPPAPAGPRISIGERSTRRCGKRRERGLNQRERRRRPAKVAERQHLGLCRSGNPSFRPGMLPRGITAGFGIASAARRAVSL
jgi:hypothetical protein